jgi:hypothetical protein
MITKRTKLVVADEHTLGYIMPNSNVVGVLQASVLRGATSSCPLSSLNPMLTYMFKTIRLATKKDFDDFRVCFNGYNNEKEYEFSK